jgi:phage-related protein
MDAVVAPLLHKIEPVVLEAVSVDVPQLFTTATVGADGAAFGAAVPCAGALTQPFTVCVTVKAAPFDTVIDAVVAPLLQRIAPVVLEAVSVDVPQLSATVTVGADGVALGAAVPCADALTQPFTVCVTV